MEFTYQSRTGSLCFSTPHSISGLWNQFPSPIVFWIKEGAREEGVHTVHVLSETSPSEDAFVSLFV